MIFGIPKELSMFKDIPESRVGLCPMGVKELTLLGATVYIESNAGERAGFSDAEYEAAGAAVVYSKEETYRRADIVLKVRLPQPEEYLHLREGQAVLGFIHLATAPKEFIRIVKEKQVTLIGYESIRKSGGKMPIVVPMSELAGKLAVQIAGRLLESDGHGRGILLGGIPGIPPANVLILGAGTLGSNAAVCFAAMGANVHILDIDRDRLEALPAYTSGMKITPLFSSRLTIEKLIRTADVFIGAVSMDRMPPPFPVTKEMVASMTPGSVILDFSIDEGGCVETARISPGGKFIYSVDNIVHFCMPNATTLVARTASQALTMALIPYLTFIAGVGLDQAVHSVQDLDNSIYAENGSIRRGG